jgi:4-hydroxybenzoate polyprenyltransferase
MLAPVVFKGVRWFKPYIDICRMESWLSWVFGFALGAVSFSSLLLGQTIAIFFAFSFATASIFVLNQYFDRQADEKNKFKSNLPIASGRISPSNALIFSFLLIVSCFVLVYMVEINLSLPLLVYLVLWGLYSAPTPKLKSMPIIDFLTSGVGAGFLPFFIGSSVPHQPSVSPSLIILATTPLILFQCGAHIIQTIGDYEADREAGVRTFVVRYGRKKGVTIAGLTFLLAFLFPFMCLFAGLVSPDHIIFFTVLLLLSIPSLMRFRHLYKNPCSSSVVSLQKTVRKYGILILIIAWIYVLITKSVFTGLQWDRII